MIRKLFVTAFVTLAFITLTVIPALAQSPDLGPDTANWNIENGWQIPVDVSQNQQSDWYDMGWETFIALMWPAQWSNWPAKAGNASGGQPDESADIRTAEPPYVAVWQTYLSPEQVFIANGAAPGTWDDPLNQVVNRNGLLVMDDFTKGGRVPWRSRRPGAFCLLISSTKTATSQ